LRRNVRVRVRVRVWGIEESVHIERGWRRWWLIGRRHQSPD